MPDNYSSEFMENDNPVAAPIYKRTRSSLKTQKKMKKVKGQPSVPNISTNSGVTKIKSVSDGSDSGSSEDDNPTEVKLKNYKNMQENTGRSPERTFVGSGSMEKMKRSQNSFNIEPMGSDGVVDDEESDYDQSGGDGESVKNDNKIQYLHFMNDRNFEKSETNMCFENEIQKFQTTARSSFQDRLQQKEMTSENLSDRKNSDLERRLHLALAKRKILNEHLEATSIGNSCSKIRVDKSVLKITRRKENPEQVLSPFVRFYLDVYKELCHKFPEKEISEEAARRWSNMSSSMRASYSKV